MTGKHDRGDRTADRRDRHTHRRGEKRRPPTVTIITKLPAGIGRQRGQVLASGGRCAKVGSGERRAEGGIRHRVGSDAPDLGQLVRSGFRYLLPHQVG
jgi:hypothetical protein